MPTFSEWFKRYARNKGVQIAREVHAEAVRLSSVPYPPASKPGKAPRKRTGTFLKNIKLIETAKGAKIVFFAPYSSFLLLGTRFMEPRPVHQIALKNVLKRRKRSR